MFKGPPVPSVGSPTSDENGNEKQSFRGQCCGTRMLTDEEDTANMEREDGLMYTSQM